MGNQLREAILGGIIGLLSLCDRLFQLVEEGLQGNLAIFGMDINMEAPGIAIGGVANAILALAFALELISILTRTDILKIESVILVVGKFMVCSGIVTSTPDILQVIRTTGADLISTSGTITFSDMLDSQIQALAGIHWGAGLIGGLVVFIACLGVLAGAILCLMMAAGRIMEIMCLSAVAPIPMAMLPYGEGGSGFNQTSIRFLKNYVAVILSGAMMVVVLSLGQGILDNLTNEFNASLPDGANSEAVIVAALQFAGMMAVAMFIIGGALSKAGQWSKSLMGV